MHFDFPPVVLFHDGNHYYMADGFHRALACERNQFRDIVADVRKGTKTDALWYALGANRANGHRLTSNDKRHAILMAIKAWPDKSGKQISDQVGCSKMYVTKIRDEVSTSLHLPSRVTGKDGKSYPATQNPGQPKKVPSSEPLPDVPKATKNRYRQIARHWVFSGSKPKPSLCSGGTRRGRG